MIVSGSGHRPADTPAKYEFKHPWKIAKLKQICNYLQSNTEINTVISGGSMGWDLWLGWASLKVGIRTVFYLPYLGFDSKWSLEHRNQLASLLSKAQHHEYVCEPGFANFKYMRRNEAMVRDCDLVLALWNPEKKSGGTFSTIQHSLKINKPVLNFWHDPECLIGDER